MIIPAYIRSAGAHLRGGGRDSLLRALTVLTDAACALLFVAALSLMRQPQVYVGVALFAFAALAAHNWEAS